MPPSRISEAACRRVSLTGCCHLVSPRRCQNRAGPHSGQLISANRYLLLVGSEASARHGSQVNPLIDSGRRDAGPSSKTGAQMGHSVNGYPALLFDGSFSSWRQSGHIFSPPVACRSLNGRAADSRTIRNPESCTYGRRSRPIRATGADRSSAVSSRWIRSSISRPRALSIK